MKIRVKLRVGIRKINREIGGVEENKGGSLTKIIKKWAGLEKKGVAKIVRRE